MRGETKDKEGESSSASQHLVVLSFLLCTLLVLRGSPSLSSQYSLVRRRCSMRDRCHPSRSSALPPFPFFAVLLRLRRHPSRPLAQLPSLAISLLPRLLSVFGTFLFHRCCQYAFLALGASLSIFWRDPSCSLVGCWVERGFVVVGYFLVVLVLSFF